MRKLWSKPGDLATRSLWRWLGAVAAAGSLLAQGEKPAPAPSTIAESVDRELRESKAAAGRGELELARAACRRALELASLQDAAAERLAALETVLLQLGRHADRLGDQPTTLAALGAVLRHREATLADDDLGVQVVRNDVANAMHAIGDLRGARALKQKVLDVFAATLADDADNLQMARGSLASTLMELGELEAALALQQKVLAIFSAKHPEEHPRMQMAQMSVAMTLSALGRLQEALVFERKVLAVRERTLPADDPALQRTRMAHAATLAELGQVDAATELQHQVVDVFTRVLPPGHPFLWSAQNNLAAFLRRSGDLRGARALLENVLGEQSAALGADHPSLQRTRGNLANTLLQSGDPFGAFELESQVLDALSAALPEGHPELEMARGNLANTMLAIGDAQGALALQQRVAKAFAEAFPADHPLLRRARGSLAVTLREAGELEPALALEREVLKVCDQQLPDHHPERNLARGNLASTLKQLGKPEQALLLEEASLRGLAAAFPDDHPDLLTARLNLAETMRQLGRVDEAVRTLTEVLHVRERVLPKDHADLQLTHLALAMALRERGDDLDACRHLQAAATAALELVGSRVLAPRVGSSLTQHSGRMLGLIADLLDPAVALPEHAAAQLRDIGLRLVVVAGSAEIHAGEIRRTLATRDPDACQRLELQLAAAARRLDEAVSLPPEGRLDGNGKSIARDDAIRDATLARDKVQREALRLVAPELRAAPETAALAAGLAPNEVAIAFCCYPMRRSDRGTSSQAISWRYGAYLLAADGRVSWQDCAADTEVADLVARLRDHVEERSPATKAQVEATLLAELDQALLAPLRGALPKGTQRLVVALARDLRLIPIDVLPTAAAMDSQQVWSLRALLRPRSERGDPAPLLAIGDVDYDAAPNQPAPIAFGMATPVVDHGAAKRGPAAAASGAGEPRRFPPLANTEAGAVVKLFAEAFPTASSTVLRGVDASESALVSRSRGARWLHVATHGYFAPERFWSANDTGRAALRRFSIGGDDRAAQLSPYSLTGLALAGANLAADEHGRREGIFTAQEAAAIDLSSCYLVTLSACESSLGRRQAGDGLASLRDAFHVAGARFVVASLWKVSDKATEQLMRDFYARLWLHGDSPQAALRAAQQAARERRAPMREWAGWVLTGR
jgi:CHAT domain-containing protein/tetratricopeptide (TPR) repeat protein